MFLEDREQQQIDNVQYTICSVFQIILVFWDLKPCTVAEIYRIVAGTYSFILREKRIDFFSEYKVSIILRKVLIILPLCTASNPRR